MAEAAARARPLAQPLRYRLEAAGAWALLGLCRSLPIDAASALGGRLGRLAGRLFAAASRRADRNLAVALPEIAAAERRRIVAGMWENLGRTVAELGHLDALEAAVTGDDRVEVVGAEHLRAAVDSGAGVLFVSAHLGNWELLPRVFVAVGGEMGIVHRVANNPLVEAMVARARATAGIELVAKGSEGTRRLIRLIKAGRTVGMLVDQRFSEGIAAPFFCRPAMTAPTPAELALRYRLPLLPARSERLDGARFRVTILAPLELPASDDRAADVLTLTTKINRLLEGWIRERPEQWLWLHRRWPEPTC
ncbi:MAG: lysophospholipid acyltransferase family protein [Alphaproteobacteria bacterium]|jgi:KDO2-lipid IV(A) lauroyltransferase|nr:lysophospholipid acyltransferase family protein [Alphaproteobacteria bacterium]